MKKTRTVALPSPVSSPLHYRMEILSANAHLFRVTLTVSQPAARQIVSLPVWIPGSYLVREFSKNLQNLTARQGTRTPVSVEQLDKCTWKINCKPGKPLTVA
ncbi:MAG: peptidase M61, partial [Polaromonas sp.]|nr:peptidase M61 [Polaromonas sp.]